MKNMIEVLKVPATVCIAEMSETAEGIKQCLIRLWLDYSTSMSRNYKSVLDTVKATLEALAKRNESAIDCVFICQIIFVGDEVKYLNSEPLDPGQLLEVFDESVYKLQGSTKIGKWVDAFDSDYSRSSGLLPKILEYGYKVFNLIFTDFVATDDDASRNASLNRLKNNTYYSRLSSTLCVFFGPENKKAEAEMIAGSVENIIAVSDNLAAYLTPMIIGSTITLTDATHINGSASTSADIAKRTKNNIENGSNGASNTKMTPEEIQKAMTDIMNATA